MSDIEILHSGETEISHITGETAAGVEFVDAYVPSSHPLAVNDLKVIDVGRIMLPDVGLEEFVEACKKSGLTVERTEGT